MTTPADELRTAAEKIRGLASKATAGVCPDYVHWSVRHIARNCAIECGHDEHDVDVDAPVWDRYEDAPYIAAMHPGVGVALADWLEAASQDSDGDHFANCTPKTCVRTAALAVARAINGSAS